MRMKSISHMSMKSLIFVGLFCLSIPLSQWLLWHYAFNQGANQAERVEVYMKYIPDIIGLHGARILSFVFSVLAIVCCSTSLKQLYGFWKAFSMVILIFSSALLFLTLFGLM